VNITDFKSFFENLTDFAPYDYQIKVAEYLLAGKNVILSVPTGAGKTWTSVTPFLYAKENRMENFPQKMIYSLPLRTLANSIYTDVNETLKSNLSFQSLTSLQTGEYCDDPHFEKDVVFSTIDQTLSNFLCFPLPLSQRQANINAGALIGSYLVFDEFHLLEPKLSMATSLGMLQLLKNLCRVCIMTATLTDDYIRFIKEKFGFQVVSIKDFPNDISQLKSLKPAESKSVKKTVTVYPDKTINVVNVLAKHKNKTIVICNRVEKAQQLYIDICRLTKISEKDNIICLHSRFFDKDRKEKEAKLRNLFGENNKENALLVSTQVIEAGMNISCNVMHTEISPINSFLQRAGRCARFENEYGEIYVYDILDLDEKEKISIKADNEEERKEIKKLNNKYLPYDKALCEKSLSELGKYDFLDEQVASILVNTVLKNEEERIKDNITERHYNIDKIQQSWHDCDKKHYRETIRDIQSIEIVLIDLENLQNKKIIPWKYETVSIYKWSFIGWAKKIEENKINCEDWVFAKAVRSEESQFDFDWIDKDSYFLRRLTTDDMKNHFDIIFVDNQYFEYTKEVGLTVSQNENKFISPVRQNYANEKQSIIFKKDTFYQHNKALLNCFEIEFKPNLKFVFSELEQYWGEKIDWEHLIKVAICFHDCGKLNSTWQEIVKEFQKQKSGIDNPQEILVHTDYDEKKDKELAKKCGMKNKPRHAGIGAYQVYEMLYDLYSEKISKIVANAILKHHSPETQYSADFCISDYGMKEMYRLMQEYKIDGELIKRKNKMLLDGIELNQKEYILYMLIVRILRLCDQKATESIEKYYRQ
jgi:CRISPR-associated endonuclease/helicase Cas3